MAELKPRADDRTILLERPRQVYTHRRQRTNSETRLDDRVAEFFTPEIHDMLQQVPDGRGNQVSVRVSLGLRERGQDRSSSSNSFRSWRRGRIQ